MRVLVTGVGGFIGGSISNTLAASGVKVYGIYRHHKPVNIDSNVSLVQADLSSMDQLNALNLSDVDAVLHFAGHHLRNESQHSSDFINSNIHSTQNLAIWASTHHVDRFINASTMSVYGEIEENEVTERTKFNQVGIYGATKYTAELLLNDFPGINPISLRFPGIVGVNDMRPAFSRIVRKMIAGQPVDVRTPSQKFNNISDISDLTRLILHLIGQKEKYNGVVNVASLEPLPLSDLIEYVSGIIDYNEIVNYLPKDGPAFSICTKLMQEDIGFQANTALEVIGRFVKNLLNNSN